MKFASLSQESAPRRTIAAIAVVALGGALGGYAIHEHNVAQKLAANNVETTAALNATQTEVSSLKTEMNALIAREQAQAAKPAAAIQTVPGSRPSPAHRQTIDPRFQKLQSQIDAQGKAIEQARSDLASTNGDLANTRTELTGSIARTHDELVSLEKKGERNYFEFDVEKSKEFKHEGPVGISLRKANTKNQYADLVLLVDDRNLTQKHVNLYQPAMFYQPDSPQPIEVIINDISKDHIHGYVSAPKYRTSELAAASTQQAANQGANDIVGAGSNQPQPRQKLPVPRMQ